MATDIQEMQKLYAKEKEFKIPKLPKEGEPQATIKILPLGLEQMDLFDIDDKAAFVEQAKQMRILISVSLGLNEEQVKPLMMGYMEDIMNAIMIANRIPEGERKKIDKIRNFVNKTQIAQAIAAKQNSEEVLPTEAKPEDAIPK